MRCKESDKPLEFFRAMCQVPNKVLLAIILQ